MSKAAGEKKPRSRIPDNELAYYENVIAASVGIIGNVKQAAYLVDDPDTLKVLLSILTDAQLIRRASIDRMHGRKKQEENQ